MHLKNSLRYQLEVYKQPLIVIGVVYLTMIALDIILGLATSPSNLTLSGPDAFMVMFAFIFACSKYASNFNMQTQNGISRKTFFTTTAISSTLFAAASSLFVFVSTLLFDWLNGMIFAGKNVRLTLDLLFTSMCYGEERTVFTIFMGTVILFFVLLVAFFAGHFFSSLFYRINSIAKVFVVVAPIVIFNVILPIIDIMFFDLQLSELAVQVLSVLFGSVFASILSLSVIAAVFAALAYVVIRRSPIKK